jgi:hypothetical protein
MVTIESAPAGFRTRVTVGCGAATNRGGAGGEHTLMAVRDEVRAADRTDPTAIEQAPCTVAPTVKLAEDVAANPDAGKRPANSATAPT